METTKDFPLADTELEDAQPFNRERIQQIIDTPAEDRTQEEQQELNRYRSTGSVKSVDAVDLGDPLEGLTEFIEAAAQERAGAGLRFSDTGEYDPELDPSSPKFHREKWLSTLQGADISAAVQMLFTQGVSALVGSFLAAPDSPDYEKLINSAMQNFSDASILSSKSVLSAEALYSSFQQGQADTIKGQPAIDESLQRILASLSGETIALNDAVQHALSPEFIKELHKKVLQLAQELPPEELQALKEELAGGAESAEDENQLTLFDEPAADQQGQQEKKPRQKRKTRFERLVEQGVIETILQNNSTNALTKFTGKNIAIDPVTGEAEITRGNFILKIPHYKELSDLKTSTWQLLDALTLKLTANPRKESEPTVKITLDEYMQRRGLRDRKAAKEQAVADLDILKSVSFTLEEIKGSGKKNSTVQYQFVNLADSGRVDKNGDITFTYGTTFHKSLVNAQIMPYSPALLQVNNHRNPNSYYLGRKISELKNMNALHRNAGNIISVKILLENAPYIPSYAEVAATNRNFTGRIIEPLERDLNALENAFSWEYCHENGRPLSEEELANFSYEVFIGCNVKFTWHDYPDQTRRKEALEARIEQAKAAANKKKPGRPRKQKQAKG